MEELKQINEKIKKTTDELKRSSGYRANDLRRHLYKLKTQRDAYIRNAKAKGDAVR